MKVNQVLIYLFVATALLYGFAKSEVEESDEYLTEDPEPVAATTTKTKVAATTSKHVVKSTSKGTTTTKATTKTTTKTKSESKATKAGTAATTKISASKTTTVKKSSAFAQSTESEYMFYVVSAAVGVGLLQL